MQILRQRMVVVTSHLGSIVQKLVVIDVLASIWLYSCCQVSVMRWPTLHMVIKHTTGILLICETKFGMMEQHSSPGNEHLMNRMRNSSLVTTHIINALGRCNPEFGACYSLRFFNDFTWTGRLMDALEERRLLKFLSHLYIGRLTSRVVRTKQFILGLDTMTKLRRINHYM